MSIILFNLIKRKIKKTKLNNNKKFKKHLKKLKIYKKRTYFLQQFFFLFVPLSRLLLALRTIPFS